MFRYAEVQAALAGLHGAYPDRMGAFRGRLQHFQRLGMAPASPGRGKAIVYAIEDVARWAFALELSECGIDPARIAKMLPWAWLKVGPYLCEKHEGEKIFFAVPTLMIAQMVEAEHGSAPASSEFSQVNLLGEGAPRYVYDVEELLNWRPGRAIIVNLTQLRGRLLDKLKSREIERIYQEGSRR